MFLLKVKACAECVIKTLTPCSVYSWHYQDVCEEVSISDESSSVASH